MIIIMIVIIIVRTIIIIIIIIIIIRGPVATAVPGQRRPRFVFVVPSRAVRHYIVLHQRTLVG